MLNQLDINELSDIEFTEKAIDIYMQAQKFDKATELIDNKLSKDSLNANLLLTKATIKLAENDTITAVLLCKKSIRADSNFKPALDTLARVFYKSKKYGEAIYFATKRLAFDTTDLKTNLLLANSLYFYGNKEKSIPFFSKTLLFDSTQTDALEKIATYKISKNMYQEAYFLLKKLEKQPNKSTNIDYNIATTLLYMGRHKESLVYYSKVDSNSAFSKQAKYMIRKLKVKLKNTP